VVLILNEHAFKSVAALELSCDFQFQLKGNFFFIVLLSSTETVIQIVSAILLTSFYNMVDAEW
jgi:hypothetical protein